MSKILEIAENVLKKYILPNEGTYLLEGNQAIITLFNGAKFSCNVTSHNWLLTLDEHFPRSSEGAPIYNGHIKFLDDGMSIAMFSNMVEEANLVVPEPAEPKEKTKKQSKAAAKPKAKTKSKPVWPQEDEDGNLVDKNGDVWDEEKYAVTKAGKPWMVFGEHFRKK